MAAAESGSIPIMEALIGVGADVNTARYDGLTALMAGCGQTNAALVKALLEAKAEPNAKDSRGVAACHMAAEVRRPPHPTLLTCDGSRPSHPMGPRVPHGRPWLTQRTLPRSGVQYAAAYTDDRCTVCCAALCAVLHCVLRCTVCCAALCAVLHCVVRCRWGPSMW
jgi:hypothetical protein